MAINQLDLGGAMLRGAATANAVTRGRQQNQLAELYQQHGAGLMSGDPAALNALAGIDPMQALQMQSARAAEQRAKQAHGYAGNREARAAELHKVKMAEIARGLTAEQAAQEQANIRRGIQAASTAQTPEEWDTIAQQFGAADLVGKFDQREQIISSLMDFDAFLESRKKEGPKYGFNNGYFYDENNPAAGATQIPGMPADAPLATVNVNTGDPVDTRPMADKPPKGFQRRYDEERKTWVDEPIPGSEAATDEEKAGRSAEMAAASFDRKSSVVGTALDRAISLLSEKGRWVSGYGSALSGVPESSAMDFQAQLDTIKANLGFEELQAMRDASPTGGALGQVSEREIAFLQAMQGNLNSKQSPEQLLETLKQIKQRRAEFARERARILSGEPAPSAPKAAQSAGGATVVEIDGQQYRVEPIE